MKNKFLIFFFIATLLNFNQVKSEEIEITSKTVTFENDGKKIIGDKDVVIKTNEGLIINADYAVYEKNKNFIKADGNVIIKDLQKEIIIKSDFIEYFGNKRIVISKGLTTAEIKNNFFVKSKNITYKIDKQIISSREKTEIDYGYKNFINIENLIYKINENLIAGENLEYFDIGDNKYSIKKGMYDIEKRVLLGKDVRGSFSNKIFGNEENEPRISGVKIYSDKQNTIINKGIFTTCKKRDGCPPWTIKAEEVRHDKSKKTINYKNSWLSIYDVPVLYFPKFFHPDPTVKRQSGFLAPRIVNSNTFGASVYLPYFKAIDIDKDITFKPKFYEGKKFILQNEYRQVTKNSESIVDFSYGKSDINQKSDNKETKNHLFFNSLIDLGFQDFESSDLKFQIQRSSDESYLKAYNIESPIIEYNSTLNNFIEFTGNKERSNLSLRASIYEDKTETKGSDKYEYVLPSYNYINYFDDIFLKDFNLTFRSNGFQRKYDTNSYEGKLVNNFTLNKDIYSGYGFKNEFLTIFKNVNTQNSVGSQDQEKIKILSEFLYKSSLPLKKTTKDFKSVLIPSLSLRYSPNKTENLINEDITVDIDNLFSIDRLGNSDIVEEDKSLTIGNEFKLFNINDREIFTLNLATNLRDNYAEDLPIKSTLNQKSSDLFGKATINLTDEFNLNYKFSLDNDYKTTNHNFFEATYSVNNFVTSFEFLEESEIRGGTSYFSNETELKFDDSNSLIFKTRENKQKDLTEFYDLIYQYKNDCLTAALEYKKEYYSDQDLKPNESLFFTITIVPFQDFQTQNLTD